MKLSEIYNRNLYVHSIHYVYCLYNLYILVYVLPIKLRLNGRKEKNEVNFKSEVPREVS